MSRQEPIDPVGEVFAPPKAELAAPIGLDPQDIRSRRELIHHERYVLAVGAFFYLLVVAVVALFYMLGVAEVGFVSAIISIPGVIFGSVAGGLWLIGYGLRRTRKWARHLATAVLVLLPVAGWSFGPYGIAVFLLALWVINSPKGARVLTPEYVEIRRRTLEFRLETPGKVRWLVSRTLFLLFLALMAVYVLAAILPSS